MVRTYEITIMNDNQSKQITATSVKVLNDGTAMFLRGVTPIYLVASQVWNTIEDITEPPLDNPNAIRLDLQKQLRRKE